MAAPFLYMSIIGASLSEPHIDGLFGSGGMVYHMYVSFDFQGSGTKFICTCPHRVAQDVVRDENGCHLQMF